MSIIDQLEGGRDYLVGCNVLDVDEVTERTINLALNNPNLQGTYNSDTFFAMLEAVPELKLEDAGFSVQDLEMEFGSIPQWLADTVKQQSELAAQIEQAKTAGAVTFPGMFDPGSASSTEQEAKAEADKIAAIKERKQEYKETSNSDSNADVDYQGSVPAPELIPSGSQASDLG